MTPSLNAISHLWVGALARFNLQLEYQKGCKNTVADVLSQITTCLNPDVLRSILDGITLGVAHWVEINYAAVVEGDYNLEQEVCVAAGCLLVQMHVTDWAEAQREDPILSVVLNWLEAHKKIELKTLLAEYTSGEEG